MARSLFTAGLNARHLWQLERLLVPTSFADAEPATAAATAALHHNQSHAPNSLPPTAGDAQHAQHALCSTPTIRLTNTAAPLAPSAAWQQWRPFRTTAHAGYCSPGGDLPSGPPGATHQHFLASVFASNQFASGGLALMVVGAAAALARAVFAHALEFLQRRMFVRADIDSRDDAYRWIMHWLSKHPSFQHSPRVSILTSLAAFGTKALEGSLVGTKQVLFIPAPGDHVVSYRGKWIWITRTRAGGAAQAGVGRTHLETLTLTAWGRSRTVLEQLTADAAAAYEETTRQRTVVHSVQDGYWERVGSRPIRPITSIILPGTQAQSLLADCKEFLESEAWYAHHGIPHRRGYLLYGAPGTGKTSLVTALAGELGIDVYVVTLSSPAMTDEMLRSLMNSAAVRSLLLLEDVDAAFVGRDATGAGCSLSFSGLLNAIDGVAAQEGRLLFMTTNHIDRLSKALIRPGRVDYRLEFTLANRDQVKRLFIFFYQDLHMFHPAPAVADTASETGAVTGLGADSREPSIRSPGEQDGVSESGTDSIMEQQVGSAGPGVLTTAGGGDDGGRQVGGAARDAAHGACTSPAVSASPPMPTLAGPQRSPHGSHSHSHANARSHGVLDAGRSAPWLEKLSQEFAALVPDNAVSMAQLQGYLMQYKTSPEGAVRGVQAWLATALRGAAVSEGTVA